MSYVEHSLLQFGGPRGTANNELWTCGIRMRPVPVDTPLEPGDQYDYLVDVCLPALENWMVRADSYVGDVAKLAFIKLNRISPDGTYAEPLTIEYFLPVPRAGGVAPGTTAAQVAQVAVALTWETDAVSRGLASKGRIYSPAPCVPVTPGTGLFSTAVALAMATSAATLISDLRGDGEAGSMVPNIISDVREGAAHRIDSVSVDNRVDIQRRRGGSLDPVRSTFAVPA